ncbi:hypothetical protein DFH06DRAFT_1300259 [Mycena polygramma]|nr:hypothetical protein DFH06DRAFT_1300259 [Mycena polygramma]
MDHCQVCLNCGASPSMLPSVTVTDLPSPKSSPDLIRLLASNEPPSESEIPSICNVISGGEAQIHALDAQMDSLDAQIDSLDAHIRRLHTSRARLAQRRTAIAEHIHQHRAMISPVRRVPSELICEIFVLVMSPRNAADRCQPPWWLGHICQSWRQTALSYSPFWSSISVPSLLSAEIDHWSRIEAQLIRAAHALLDISWPEVQDKVDPALLRLVLPHCSRWRSLCFDVHPSYDSEDRLLNWLRPVNGHLGRLEQLQVITAKRMVIPDVFSNAPNLRQIVFTDENFYPSPASIVIPWGQITHSRVTFTEERHLEIFNDTSNLLECSIGFTNFHNSGPDTLRILHRLRRLCIEDDRFLRHLTAPLLVDLTIVWFTSATLPFLQRSSCTLKKLAIMRCRIDSALTDVLRNLPSLTHLLLAINDVAPEEDADGEAQIALFGEMSISVTRSFCPNLTTFVFGYRSSTPWDAFFTMAQTRLQRNPTLALRIFNAGDLTSDPSDSLEARVKTLQDDGMDVKLLDNRDSQRLITSFCGDVFSVLLEL